MVVIGKMTNMHRFGTLKQSLGLSAKEHSLILDYCANCVFHYALGIKGFPFHQLPASRSPNQSPGKDLKIKGTLVCSNPKVSSYYLLPVDIAICKLKNLRKCRTESLYNP